MRSRYRLYGLTVSSPLDLPCPRADRCDAADVTLIPGTEARFAEARREIDANEANDWFRCWRVSDGSRYLCWAGLFEFLVSPDGRRIFYRRLARATPESFNVYLLGPVLSFSLLALGVEALHGTAAVIDGRAVVFMGGCGWGKSTLAAALLARGFPVLTDDLVALAPSGRAWLVHPGMPRLKLFPAVARRLLGIEAREPRMNDGTSKLVLPLAAGQASRKVSPLKTIYVLPEPAERRPASVRIEPVSMRHAFLELVGAAFNLAVVERERLAKQFAFVSRLTTHVPVRRLSYPRRLSALPAVCDAVVADAVAASPGSALPTCAARTATT